MFDEGNLYFEQNNDQELDHIMDDGQRMMEHGLFTDTRKNVDIWGDYLWRK